MKRVLLIGMKIIAVVVLFLCLVIAWFYIEIGLPYKTIYNLSWWIPITSEKDYTPNKKVRTACHKLLRYRFLTHYDAALYLRYVGNKDSIPYLIRVSKWEYLKHQDKIETYKRLPITFRYCVGSLERLTGMEFGTDYEAWENWWEQTGKHLPFDEEKGQLVLPENHK